MICSVVLSFVHVQCGVGVHGAVSHKNRHIRTKWKGTLDFYVQHNSHVDRDDYRQICITVFPVYAIRITSQLKISRRGN